MNKVSLVGNICRDVETTYTSGDNATAILRNTIAVQRKYKNKETGQYDSDFINIIAYSHTAEFIKKFFTKGQKIGIVGHIQTGSYTNKDGQKVYTTDVIVEDAEFVTPRGENASAGKPSSDDFINQGVADDITSGLPF